MKVTLCFLRLKVYFKQILGSIFPELKILFRDYLKNHFIDCDPLFIITYLFNYQIINFDSFDLHSSDRSSFLAFDRHSY